MKKGFLTLFLLSITIALFAQQSAKRYVMLEHFTNSRCSVCASKNPSFYNFINQYPNDIHHIAIHPSMPYNNCFFYLANPVENNERAYFYNIIGTPSVALNGTLLNPSTPLLNSAQLQPYLNKTSPIYLKVTETGTGNTRSASIDVHSLGTLPNIGYKIYAVIVEKTVNYNAPNGETVHHDVFRKIVPEVNGIAFTPAPVGQSNVINFNYTIANNWVADEVYILAYVQSAAPEIINSGTKYDPLVLSASDAKVETIAVMPNPATDQVYFQLPDEQVQTLEIFDVKGQRMAANFSQEQDVVQVPVAQLASGMYFFKITGTQKVYTAKLIKE
jgi:thiol-disulfide isomerase/thioredoxin